MDFDQTGADRHTVQNRSVTTWGQGQRQHSVGRFKFRHKRVHTEQTALQVNARINPHPIVILRDDPSLPIEQPDRSISEYGITDAAMETSTHDEDLLILGSDDLKGYSQHGMTSPRTTGNRQAFPSYPRGCSRDRFNVYVRAPHSRRRSLSGNDRIMQGISKFRRDHASSLCDQTAISRKAQFDV